jgi:hypothetical protein
MIHTSSGHTQQATSKGHRKRRTSIDTSSPYLLDSGSSLSGTYIQRDGVVASILNVCSRTRRGLKYFLSPIDTVYRYTFATRFVAVPVHCKQLHRLLTSLSIEQTVFTPLTRGNRVRNTSTCIGA